MKLLTVGDSFTYGEELAEISDAWPYLLADLIGYELDNLARPGSGNSRMVRNCVEQHNNYDLIIVAWSHFARIETADENGFYDLWPGCDAGAHKAYSPWRKELIEYTNRHHSDEYLYNQYLLNIILLQNYLTANNKRYIMLDSFGNHQANQRWHNQLVGQIDTRYYIGWPNESMMEWTYKTPQGPRGHFLEQGHKQVAEKIYEHIRHLSWVS
jgi:hypothetical protein